MMFRHAFYISIAAHIIIFGSAIAVAQFSGALLSSSHDALTVALVSSGPSSGPGKPAIPRPKQHEAPSEVPAPEAMKEPAAEAASKPGSVSAQPAGQKQQDGGPGNDDVAPKTDSKSAGQGTSGQVSAKTPGEWAVLAAAIERTKSYPRLARERGIEGVVRLRFRLASSGAVEKIEILQSSGFEILDNASIGAVYRAAPLPYVSGWVEVPMKYVLK